MKKKSYMFSKIGYVWIVVVITLIMAVYLLVSDSRFFGFSHKSGFYDNSFELRISKPIGTRVFYTLDGSVPTVDSMEYKGPIVISDASANPNVYANIKEVVPEYDEEGENALNYVIPKENIDKCNVVRAICVDKDGVVLNEKHETYFVGFNEKSGYEGMWVCSLITDPQNLFDSKQGIMVSGDSFEIDGEGKYINANYSFKGIDWEREAFVQFFDSDKKNVLNQMCGLRIHGHVSRSSVSKSFRLYSREEYDGNDKFLADFWGDEYYPDKMLLLSGGQDGVTLVRDKLVSDLTRDFAYSSYHYIPCVLFLDGEYWGIHYITEKFDAEYFNHYFGTDKEDLLVLKDFMSNPEWALTEGTFDMERDNRKWNDFAKCIAGMEEMGLTQKAFEDTFDYNSFLDYFATEIYIARNGDWPPLNISYWSSRNYGTKPNDGKWRFLLFDVYYDSMSNPNHDTIGYARQNFALLNYELDNEKFVSDLNLRLREMGDTVFSEESIDSYLNQYSELMREPIIKHYRRFYGDRYDGKSFDEAIENIKMFFSQRKDYIKNYY